MHFVRRLIKKRRTRIVFLSSSKQHIISAVFPKHLRIPHMPGIILRIIRRCEQAFFRGKMNAILTCRIDHIRFPAIRNIVIIAIQLDISGVEQFHLSVLRKCRAGIHPVAVIRTVRKKRHTLVGPVQHVFTFHMPPEFQSSLRVKRRVLKEEMIVAIIVTKSVRIVQPSYRRHDMKTCAPPCVL